MARTTTAKNALATAYAAAAVSASAHSGDPSTTGALEISGGSPAYARKTPTWSAASGGVVSTTVIFDVAAGVTVGGGGLWNGSGNFLDGGTVTAVPFASQGTYTMTFSYSQG